jgi:hypothetical protein
VVLTGRIRVQIFGSPGARDSRYGLPDSLFGSELRRALQGVRCFLVVSAQRVTTFAMRCIFLLAVTEGIR